MRRLLVVQTPQYLFALSGRSPRTCNTSHPGNDALVRLWHDADTPTFDDVVGNRVISEPNQDERRLFMRSGIDSHAGATHVAQGLDSWKANYLNVTSALSAR
jgi:hypothetical protein